MSGLFISDKFCYSPGGVIHKGRELQFRDLAPPLYCLKNAELRKIPDTHRCCEVWGEMTAWGAAFVEPFKLLFVYHANKNFNVIPPPFVQKRKTVREAIAGQVDNGPYDDGLELDLTKLRLKWDLPAVDMERPLIHPDQDRLLSKAEYKSLQANRLEDWIAEQARAYLSGVWGEQDYASRYCRKDGSWHVLSAEPKFKQFILTELTPF